MNDKSKRRLLGIPVLSFLLLTAVLVYMFVNQKNDNFLILMEYRAAQTAGYMADNYLRGLYQSEPASEAGVLGFGLYYEDGTVLYKTGTAPDAIDSSNIESGLVRTENRSVTMIRPLVGRPGDVPAGSMMRRMPVPAERPGGYMGGHSGGADPVPGRMQGRFARAQLFYFIEYGNPVYEGQLRLNIATVAVIILIFGLLSFIIFRLYRTNRRLEHQSENEKRLIQLGEAARTLAHEIRNPLGTLKVQRDILKKKLPEEFHDNLAVMDRELARLGLIVGRVGEFLRNPAGKNEAVCIFEFASSLYADKTGVGVTAETPAAVKAEIVFDRDRLRTVLDNLVDNALDFSASVDIRIGVSGRAVWLRVDDQGPGFSREDAERAFDPFYTGKPDGTGLGLAIVRRLVEAAGGEVSIPEGKPGGHVMLKFHGAALNK